MRKAIDQVPDAAQLVLHDHVVLLRGPEWVSWKVA
jgi:hypothetical protein